MKKFLPTLTILLLFLVNANGQGDSTGAGLAIHFPGKIGDYIDLGDSYNNLNFPFSFEAWVNLTTNGPVSRPLFSTDNDHSAYYGFWITFQKAQLIIDFGNGQGSGVQFRGGRVTVDSIEPEQWVHVALVCKSFDSIYVYFNGILQSTTKTGGAQINSLVHSSAPAFIGATSSIFGESVFSGSIDEIRLWNVALSQHDILVHMCNKIKKDKPGLIGYWTADESFTSTSLLDYSSRGVEGSFQGTIKRKLSGAYIGDTSTFIDTTDWTGVKLSLKDSITGDKFTVSKIKKSPAFVQVYEVKSNPYSDSGLNYHQRFYFGVFTSQQKSTQEYNVTYAYSEDDGIIDDENKSTAQLMTRGNGADTIWQNVMAVNDTAAGNLQEKQIPENGEYILNIPASPIHRQLFAAASNQLNIFPNPVNDKLFFTLNDQSPAVQTIIVSDILGKEKMVLQAASFDWSSGIDVSKLPDGIYFLQVISDSGRTVGEFTIAR